jgi:hypothetical protein
LGACLTRALGYLTVAGGVAFLGLAIVALTQSGFEKGFLGALVTGCTGISAGLNLILQSKGLMD